MKYKEIDESVRLRTVDVRLRAGHGSGSYLVGVETLNNQRSTINVQLNSLVALFGCFKQR